METDSELRARAETVTLSYHRNGRVTVDRWPRLILFDLAMGTSGASGLCRLDGDVLTLTVSNGRAVYHLEQECEQSMAALGYLESCWIQECVDGTVTLSTP